MFFKELGFVTLPWSTVLGRAGAKVAKLGSPRVSSDYGKKLRESALGTSFSYVSILDLQSLMEANGAVTIVLIDLLARSGRLEGELRVYDWNEYLRMDPVDIVEGLRSKQYNMYTLPPISTGRLSTSQLIATLEAQCAAFASPRLHTDSVIRLMIDLAFRNAVLTLSSGGSLTQAEINLFVSLAEDPEFVAALNSALPSAPKPLLGIKLRDGAYSADWLPPDVQKPTQLMDIFGMMSEFADPSMHPRARQSLVVETNNEHKFVYEGPYASSLRVHTGYLDTIVDVKEFGDEPLAFGQGGAIHSIVNFSQTGLLSADWDVNGVMDFLYDTFRAGRPMLAADLLTGKTPYVPFRGTAAHTLFDIKKDATAFRSMSDWTGISVRLMRKGEFPTSPDYEGLVYSLDTPFAAGPVYSTSLDSLLDIRRLSEESRMHDLASDYNLLPEGQLVALTERARARFQPRSQPGSEGGDTIKDCPLFYRPLTRVIPDTKREETVVPSAFFMMPGNVVVRSPANANFFASARSLTGKPGFVTEEMMKIAIPRASDVDRNRAALNLQSWAYTMELAGVGENAKFIGQGPAALLRKAEELIKL
jgi:hypothetical protein